MKKRHICAVFSFCLLCFAIFGLLNGCVSGANEYWFWGWALIRCWLFLFWMFLGIKFGRVGECIWRIEWTDDWGRSRFVLAVLMESLTRARMRAPVPGVLFFCCHKCHSGWGWKYFINPKTTCRFVESDVSFYWKRRVVWDWRLKSCVEDGVLKSFWGGVAAWKCDSFWVLFRLLM